MKSELRHIVILVLVVLLAGCSEESIPAAEQPIAPAGSRPVVLAVQESGWNDETVSVTRTGETLNELKTSTARTWDFTRMSTTDLAALKADAEKAEGALWMYSEENARYSNTTGISGTTLQANGIELSLTTGLQFSNVSASNFHIRPNKDIQMGGTNQVLTIPGLKKGQMVTIKFASASNDQARTLATSNLSSTSGFGAATGSSTQTGTGTVTADGAVTFTSSGGAINLYGISVSREEGDGFGLYSDRLKVLNSHVVWDADILNWAGISNDFYLMLWPDNVIKYSVAFNGSDEVSKGTVYSYTGNHNFNDKFTGCTYQGITFTKGLKMESTTSISITSSAKDAKVTIVQSDWQSNEVAHGTPATLLFDGATLDVASAESITGGKVYTIRGLSPGEHTITRGSGESGIFYVSVDIPFTAYSPYISDESLPADPENVSADYYGIVSRNASSLVFKPHSDNRIDLMYAEDFTSADGTVYLNFKHALGKLSIGTITNNYGEDISLNQITIRGTRCTQATLSLSTGEWGAKVTESSDVVYNSSLLATLFGDLDIPNKGTLTFPREMAYIQIPGTELDFEYEFLVTGTSTTFTVTKNITIVQGKNIYVNIIIGQNHEVVLE